MPDAHSQEEACTCPRKEDLQATIDMHLVFAYSSASGAICSVAPAEQSARSEMSSSGRIPGTIAGDRRFESFHLLPSRGGVVQRQHSITRDV